MTEKVQKDGELGRHEGRGQIVKAEMILEYPERCQLHDEPDRADGRECSASGLHGSGSA